jgi:hypothetical protein
VASIQGWLDEDDDGDPDGTGLEAPGVPVAVEVLQATTVATTTITPRRLSHRRGRLG